MNNDEATADSSGKFKHKEIYQLKRLSLRRPTICIELGNYQDRLRDSTEGIAQDYSNEYNTVCVCY
jgi:hypothetical protein